MGDANFDAAVTEQRWIVGSDPYFLVQPGWATLFSEALDHVGRSMADRWSAVVRGLEANENLGSLRIYAPWRLPPEIKQEVQAI